MEIPIRPFIIFFGLFGVAFLACIIRHLWRNTCSIHHRQKRYIAMDLHGSKNAQGIVVPRCHCWSDSRYPSDHHRFLMRWFCDACKSMGEHCWDKKGEWRLEMGKIVPDEKRWAQRL